MPWGGMHDAVPLMKTDRVRILFYNRPWSNFPPAATCECCELSFDKGQSDQADVVVFHLPELRGFPRRKREGQLWAALCAESAVHYPALAQRGDLSGLFDLWMTYQQDADVWCPYIDKSFVPALHRAASPKSESSLAVAFVSSRFDRSGRTDLLRELMRHMPINSYGKIEQNRTLPRDEGTLTRRDVQSRYRFSLAFENAIDRDYVTEKFFDPLMAGSVPVYLGAPNIEEFAPGDDCFIDVRRFARPELLAAHLRELAADEAAYQRHLAWKSGPLRGSFLRMVEAVTSPIEYRCSRLVRERLRRQNPNAPEHR